MEISVLIKPYLNEYNNLACIKLADEVCVFPDISFPVWLYFGASPCPRQALESQDEGYIGQDT